MGSNDNPNDLPHIVSQPDFYIDSKEVTNLAYLSCRCIRLLAAGLVHLGHLKGYITAPEFNFYPVLDALRPQRASSAEQAGKRLPTEAEWEKAASWNAANHLKSIRPFWRSVRRGKAELG